MTKIYEIGGIYSNNKGLIVKIIDCKQQFSIAELQYTVEIIQDESSCYYKSGQIVYGRMGNNWEPIWKTRKTEDILESWI